MNLHNEKELPWPKVGVKLFVEDGDNEELSEIGGGHISIQFVMYINGYKAAADELVEEVIKSNLPIKRNTYSSPICFLYRQYLELEMKSLYVQYSEASRDDKKKAINDIKHNLLKLWRQVKPVIVSCASSDSDKRAIVVVEDYIKQFHEQDKTSVTFRYPITKNLEKIHEHRRLINLQDLRDRMNELYSFFIGCEGALSEWRKNAQYIG